MQILSGEASGGSSGADPSFTLGIKYILPMLLNRGCKQRDALNAILGQIPSEPEQMNIQGYGQGQGQGMDYQQQNIQQYQQYQNKMRQSNKKETDNKSIQTSSSSSSSHSNANPNIPQIPPLIQENRFVEERMGAIPGNIVGQMWWEGQRYEDKGNNYQYIDDEDEDEQEEGSYLY
ncbi:MAG: hypothetical protein EZS28_035459 [Streblomastix strix]|uniref:Uncharacterized protein n=1 Tax=Streblomastix strix TaxID=222440 RepID=A0A5J4UFK1_9EUKA|nr:MAG: hypothetical protein EZS28_035459 [Streblomastix strix]